MAFLKLFSRLIARPLKHEPLRTALTALAVALGVSVVLAIELAGGAAAGSFRASLETLTGGADFEVTAAGGVPISVLTTLATLPQPIRVSPRIEGFARMSGSAGSVPIIGLDLVADAPQGVAGSQEPAGEWKLSGGVWAGAALGLKPGEKIRLTVNDREREYTVRGMLSGVQGEAGRVLVMDIEAAEEALGRAALLDRILIDVPEIEVPGAAPPGGWEAVLGAALPAGVDLEPLGVRTGENRRMLAAFRWNLRVLSYIALIVGAFLIYNTISVSVVRRRPEIGILRALGASRHAVLAAFLGEAALFGLAGAAIGIPLGRVMAEGAVQLLGATVQSLYVSSRPAPVVLTPEIVLFALFIGLGLALASAWAPAREAAAVSAADAMARGRSDYHARISRTRNLLLAVLLAGAAGLASAMPPLDRKPVFGYVAALLLIAAAALAIPAMVAALSAISSALLRRVFGVEAMLAARSLAGSLRRTSVLVGALATAVAMMASVGIMVGSFRETVQVWMENQLRADLYLRPGGPSSADRHPTMSPDIPDRIAALPGVAAVDRFRAYAIRYNGLPATLGAGETAVIARYGRLRLLSGDLPKALAALPAGDNVLVSEPFANKHGVRTGSEIELPLGGSARRFRVLGVYYDYASERGYVIMDRSVLLKYLPDPAPSSVAVYAKPGVDVDELRRAVDAAAGGRSIAVVSNRALRAEAIRIFDRTFAITYALEAVAVVVAVMGIAGALLALVIDRRRELGLLRFLGASAGQVRRLILFEAGLLGLLANIAGLLLGFLLSLILIFVINKQSFGWTIQFHWPAAVLLAALSVVYLATILAGLYPARVAMRLNPIEVVHEE